MTPTYQGIALGGTKAGEMLSAHRPLIKITPKVAIMGVKQEMEEYYYVPLMGMQGFWISESETKGTGPWDDIIRILSEAYVASLGTGNTSDIN